MIVVSRFMVPKGFAAMTIFPFVFVARKELKKNDRLINHEKIHIRQQLEYLIPSMLLNFGFISLIGVSPWWLLLCILPFLNSSLFYIWYVIEAIFKGYKNISFEKEANANENSITYLKRRKLFANLKYL